MATIKTFNHGVVVMQVVIHDAHDLALCKDVANVLAPGTIIWKQFRGA
jgi:hypothetical protein